MAFRNLSKQEFVQLLDNKIFRLISQTADELSLECYVVGGYVRDLFLERASNDIDVVVVGSGIKIAEVLHQKLRGSNLAVFRNYGTAQVKYHGLEIEFVGARRESYHHLSRNPIVEDGTLEDDQNRRDFTINALAICLNNARFGELIDPFDGLLDLEDGIIATPLDPNITFSDDPLRMMRCIRFATQLHFLIEEDTFRALYDNRERIKIVSCERILTELNKILLSPTPSLGFVDLERAGLLEYILPEVSALLGVEMYDGKGHKDNFFHTMQVLDNVVKTQQSMMDADDKVQKQSLLWLRWAALLHDIGKVRTKRYDQRLGWTFHNHNAVGAKMVKDIFRRLKMPLDQSTLGYVAKLVDLHMRPINIADDKVTDSAVRRLLSDAGDDIDDLMTLCESDLTTKNTFKKKFFLENFRIVREKLTDLKEKDYKRLLQPCLDGDELMELFNLEPGPEVGRLKKILKDAILDGLVENEHDALYQYLINVLKKE